MPSTDDSTTEPIKSSWPLQCARASLVAPFAAMLVQVLTLQLVAKRESDEVSTAHFVSSTIAALLIASGFLASLAGFWGARRQRSTDTQIIACLGMFISGGLLLLTIWAIALRSRGEA